MLISFGANVGYDCRLGAHYCNYFCAHYPDYLGDYAHYSDYLGDYYYYGGQPGDNI